MKKTKTKKQSNIKPVMAKIVYIAIAVCELGAVVMLSLVSGDTKAVLAKVFATGVSIDLLIRLCVISKPFLKSE